MIAPDTSSRPEPHRHADAGGVAAVIGALIVVVGAALPWVQTGRVRRSAFTVVRVANEIGVFEQRSQRVAVLTLLATPAVASLGLLLLSIGRRRLAALCLLLVGLLGLVIGVIGMRFGSRSSASLPGPMVTTMGGVISVLGAVFAARRRRRVGSSLQG